MPYQTMPSHGGPSTSTHRHRHDKFDSATGNSSGIKAERDHEPPKHNDEVQSSRQQEKPKHQLRRHEKSRATTYKSRSPSSSNSDRNSSPGREYTPVSPDTQENDPNEAHNDSFMDVDPSPEDISQAFRGVKRSIQDVPDRPSSRASASSLGSVDSGLSHPPQSGRKKRKFVRMSISDVENWRQERAEADAPRPPRVWPNLSSCDFCDCQFKEFTQLQDHWSEKHRGKYKWSCQELPFLMNFHVDVLGPEDLEDLYAWHSHCRLCDDLYGDCPNGNCEIHGKACAEAHQLYEHNVGRCGVSEGFYDLEEFRQHLFNGHALEPPNTCHMMGIVEMCQLEAVEADEDMEPDSVQSSNRQVWKRARCRPSVTDVMEE